MITKEVKTSVIAANATHEGDTGSPEDIAFPNQVITESELVGEMEDSYRDYAMSVIVGRALPDVRDGLKPVHRRILYAMYEDNLTSDKPFKKSATCVGDVLGRYHPHGDASVYDAMVRLAQDFSMRYMLVDGHGNFGSVDGDPPAAYRYTEARLSKISNEMLRDIDKETVDWDPNFDESRKEPRVLPSRFPNLLVNGSSGIAVGMATNIPPHNLTEVINACVCVLDNPEATLPDLMQHIKGPDFPTKGIIMGRSGIRQAYATGRGRVIVRARTEFEEFGRDRRTRIIVNELPYQVNKRQLIKNIADQVREKRLEGISDLRDESDRNGMRMVIELKRDANPQVVLNRLFAQTALQSSFSINMLALVNNQRQPKILSLRHIIDEYLTFQEDIIVRRTRYDLRKAEERAHLLEGLLIAQDNIDEVIHIIRTSYDDAKQNLMKRFGLSDVQAQAICDMRLISLQGLNREKLELEYKELEEKITYLKSLLADPELIKGVLKDELIALRDKYGDKRRTEIQDVVDEIDMEDLIEEEQCVFTLTHGGYIKRLPVSEYRAQGRGGKGVRAMATKDEDFVETVFTASTHDNILFPHLNVFENVAFPLREKKVPRDEIDQRVNEMLSMVALTGFEHRSVTSLSGGQQQRVAIARALISRPKVLLLDEPLAALDLKLRKDMQQELKKIQKAMGITFVFVTHDQEEALSMSDTVVVMSEGRIQQIGTPIDIYNEPQNAFVADFIGESNILDGVMLADYKVNFSGHTFDCVDAGFEKHENVDVVIRPEDVDIVSEEKGMLKGIVTSVTFLGVHYEIIVDIGGIKWMIQTTDFVDVDEHIGLYIEPDAIHIMKKSEYSGMYGDYSSFSNEFDELSDAESEIEE